jgi:hypothetical protein
MKKFLIVLMLLMFISPVFARTIQCVKKYQVYTGIPREAYDITPAMQSMINMGWRIVSVTPITAKDNYANPTYYVIVVFEMEEHK